MRYLLDTNVVLRAVNQDDELHAMVTQAIRQLSSNGHEFVMVSQIVYEFWSVASRPKEVNGLGWPAPLVRSVVDELTAAWTLLDDSTELYQSWLELVTTYQVAGRQVHDARLAAAMQVHRLDAALTLNVKDFERFGLSAIHPGEVTGY